MEISNKPWRCTAGESFDSIALALYGNEKYAAELLSANPELCGTVAFAGGERLRVPILNIIDSEQENDYPASNAPWRD